MDRTFFTSRSSLAGVLLALASSMAHGQVVDLDATGTMSVGTVTLSEETLNNGKVVTVGAQTYYTFTAATSTNVLQVDGKIDVRGRAGDQLYIRYDLTNMVFATAASETGAPPSTGTVRIPDADNDLTEDSGGDILTLTREMGGTPRSDFVVYAAPNNAVIDRQAVVSAYITPDLLAILPEGNGEIAMSVFLDRIEALVENGRAVTSKKKTAVTIASSVSTRVTPGAPVTASVTSGFTQLTSLGTVSATARQPLGSVNIRVGPTSGMHLSARDGEPVVALGDVMRPTASTMTFSGDFSLGTFALSADDCATALANSLRMNEAKDEATVTPTLLATGARSLCFSVPGTNKEPIPAGVFMVAADYAPLTNADFGPLDLEETEIGRIRRDGTSVQIPYLTTAPEYNQRIVIVNRLPRAAGYNFAITAMDDTTAAAGEMASGTIPANTTMVVSARDVVTVTGGTEASATLNVVATAGHIDVSTTQINSRGETDSVVYESMPN